MIVKIEKANKMTIIPRTAHIKNLLAVSSSSGFPLALINLNPAKIKSIITAVTVSIHTIFNKGTKILFIISTRWPLGAGGKIDWVFPYEGIKPKTVNVSGISDFLLNLNDMFVFS